ncbi:MAG: hypothetical protein ACPHCI_02935 [Solirubrobacterales bacterium]
MSNIDNSADAAGANDSSRSSNIRRRRLLLYGFGVLALGLIVAFAATTLIDADDSGKSESTKRLKPPLIVERFRLTATKGEKGRGLGELVRREDRDGLRVIAVGLEPSAKQQAYQLLLAGGRDSRVLGNQVIGEEGTFIGEARITSAELREFDRIELRRVTEGSPPQSDLVLRGRIAKQ